MYLSGRAEVTEAEMREAEKRGPWVDGDMVARLPVVAAGDFHIVGAVGRWSQLEIL